MDKKLILVGLMGMNKDVINSKTAQLQAYEIKNFRLSATLDSNAFELTTERGTKSIQLEWKDSEDNQILVNGTIIGYCVLNNYLVLFTTDHQRLVDRIYRITLNSNEFLETVTEIVLLYEGDTLGFNSHYLIDAIPYYETELIQKVYWIDGINLPRVINIVSDGDIHTPLNNPVNYDPYGFVLEIYDDYNSIQVTKGYVGGMFHAGVIQYAYSFFNENALETPVIDVTPLYYIAHEDRGEKPDTRVGCTFTLTLNVPIDFHDKFDYIRFYSIYRSSLNTTPLVKVINEVETSKLTPILDDNELDHYELSFVDDNTLGYVYDALLLLIRNNKIIPQTFNYKDGKLFFGNFKNDSFDKKVTNLDSFVGKKEVHWGTRQLNISTGNWRLLYDYKNQLKKNSREIRTFKGLEYYKLGILLLDIYGNWGEPILMGTYKNTNYPAQHDEGAFYTYDIPIAEMEWYDNSDTPSLLGSSVAALYSYLNLQTYIDSGEQTQNYFDLTKYVRVRPVVSFPNSSERNVLCQGVVNPTMFNLNQRVNGTLFALSSWFYRPVPCVYGNTYEGTVTNPGGDANQFGWGASYVLWRHNAPLFNTILPNGEALNMYTDEYSSYSEIGFSDDNKFISAFPDYETITTEPTQYETNLVALSPSLMFLVDEQPKYGNCYEKRYNEQSDWYYYEGEEPYERIGIVCVRDTTSFLSVQLYRFDGVNMSRILNIFVDGYIIKCDRYWTVLTGSSLPEGDYMGTTYTIIFNTVSGSTPFEDLPAIDDFIALYGSTYIKGIDIPYQELGSRPSMFADEISNTQKEKYEGFYFVDNQICTLNSPDIEFNTDIQNTDSENYKVKFVGISEFTNFNGKYNIIAENPLFLNNVVIKYEDELYTRGTQLSKGFYDKSFNNSAFWGGLTVSALNCWFDDACNLFTWDERVWLWNKDKLMKSYVVYPWQRKYLNNFNNNQFLIENSLENDNESSITEELPTSTIIKKILGNIKVGQTIYNIGNDSTFEERCWDTNNTFLKQYNSEEPTLLKLTNNLYYSGNVDLLVTSNSEYKGLLFNKRTSRVNINWLWDNAIGYPLVVGLSKPLGNLDESCGKWYGYLLLGLETYGTITTPNNRSVDPIWIRYKSSPHFVFDIGKEYSEVLLQDIERTLPIYSIKHNGDFVFYSNSLYSNDIDAPTGISTIWNGSSKIYTPEINTNYTFPYLYGSSNSEDPITVKAYNYLWIADIFKGTNLNTYTNDSSKSFENLNRLWIPCGDSYPFNPNNDSKIQWVEGDTFFLRYDCLKTYPFSNDDLQSVVEIGSFMLETRVNLDGRYDTNRGLMDNTAITKENFNLINPVYSQLNNFFLYRILDDRFNNKETEYKNRITWTLDKLNGDDVDLWTRVTELGILDLDGDKGKVTKIERFDNNLYIFLDKGIARLNYNDNIQIPTEGNIPIEVVNSGFINGKRYISENQGLQDKWCSKSTPYGIFFKDDYSKALCTVKYDERRNPVVAPLSYGSMLKWTELNIDDIYMVNYDNQVNEVLFMIENNEDYSSLSYSPLYQAFTAFYDYKDWVGNYNNSTISLLNSSSSTLNIYFLRRAADEDNNDVPIFNYFYGELKPYWINFTSVVDNYDCIFDNLYLKSNIYDLDKNSMNDKDIDITLKGDDIYQGDGIYPFDLISVSNDKQAYELESVLADIWKEFKPIKKFGVWRGRIPRINSINGKYLGSRIRNHWTRIGLKISSEKLSTKKTVVRDIKVDAFF